MPIARKICPACKRIVANTNKAVATPLFTQYQFWHQSCAKRRGIKAPTDKLKDLRQLIYTTSANKSDENKYINPMTKDNPFYRSGINNGLLYSLQLIDKIFGTDNDN